MKFEHDDIAAISAYAGVDFEYQSFHAPLDEPGIRKPGPVSKQAIAGESDHVTNVSQPAILIPRTRHSVFDEVTTWGTQKDNAPGWKHHLPLGSFSFSSLGGGSGVTTIQATLGRIFARRGGNPLLVERARDGLLPCYFGAPTDGWGKSMYPSQKPEEGSIHVLSGGMGAGSISEDSIWRAIGTHRQVADRVLLEEWAQASDETMEILKTEATRIVVLVADPQTAIRLRRCETSGQSPDGLLFLLNKFDSSVTLHNDMKNWLRHKLGAKLIDVTLRRSDEVASAMAEGTTVTEYAPDGGISQDFAQLAEWMCQKKALSRGSAAER